jgi:protein MpaA
MDQGKRMKYIGLLLLMFACATPPTQKVATQSSVFKKVKITKDNKYQVFTSENTKKMKAYCKRTELAFKKYNWGKSHCEEYTWNHVRNSHWGHPIPWFVFGDEETNEKKTSAKNTTMILCGVHGDEITPVKFCYDIMEDLRNNPELVKDHVVVIAPLVSPDSFFKKRPTRTNARGVDVNRNFPTKDWGKSAKKLWKARYRSDERRYPGKYALSEQETIFQVNLINRYNPKKIISVHAPLTLLDYDGPAFSHVHGKAAKQLLIQMSQKANKYKVSNYPFFTGSLGNWAGNERNIPTYTLELPNSDWNKTDKYFNMFKLAIREAIEHKLDVPDPTAKKVSQNKKNER